MKEYPKVLAIAGSEQLGSAGVQADIKAISACGSYAAGALTCIVNEDTMQVKEVFPLPVELIIGQVRSFLDDVHASAIKTGMLFKKEVIKAVAETLKDYPDIPLVVDPVMVNSTGEPLIEPDAIEAYKEYLFPLATIITPNYREANLLLKHDFCGENPENDMKELCQWGNAAIVKSIPYKENLMDAFSSKDHSIQKYVKEKINTKNVNGTGCTFSSSIAAFLSQGHPVEEAVRLAEDYIHNAIKEGATYKFGSGIGPVTHFYKWLKMS